MEDSLKEVLDKKCAKGGIAWVSLWSILAASALALSGLMGLVAARGANPQAAQAATTQYPPVVHLTSEQDHQRTMDLLHMTTIRQGRNGTNPADPNYANYDESKANPYPTLPDPLVLNNGKKVKTAAIWWKKRRPEIVEDFDREVYG